MRKRIATLTALGIGGGSFYLLNRDRRARNTSNETDAANILKRIRDAAFDSSDEKLALALGRPTEEIETWTTGAGVIDGDVVMKARQLAVQRGVEL
ncbi:MAG TPA: hypothetical protein VKC61_18435 [Pyrinomonadaceae bacterium]|nr:hypothetical protein [Pyrinomonadaceae bacterium]